MMKLPCLPSVGPVDREVRVDLAGREDPVDRVAQVDRLPEVLADLMDRRVLEIAQPADPVVEVLAAVRPPNR